MAVYGRYKSLEHLRRPALPLFQFFKGTTRTQNENLISRSSFLNNCLSFGHSLEPLKKLKTMGKYYSGTFFLYCYADSKASNKHLFLDCKNIFSFAFAKQQRRRSVARRFHVSKEDNHSTS